MASYVTITDSQVDPEAPITSESMSALRDNPTAIAEGASGAPRVTFAALSGQSRSFSGSVSPGSPVDITISDDYAFFPKFSSDSAQVRLQFYPVGGSLRFDHIGTGSNSYSINWRYVF